MHLLKLIRWKNLLIIVLAQLLVKYAVLVPFGIETALNSTGILLLIIATVCIAAAGNIINDIYDVEADYINKPDQLFIDKHISEKMAYNLFIGFNIIGVGVGFYLSHLVNKSAFFALFVITSALLYVYASYLKSLPLIGNIVISILVGLSILIVGIFEIMPLLTIENRTFYFFYFKIVFSYSLFAFIINLLREVVKDIEDIEGDNEAGYNTLPLAIGISRSKYMLLIISLLPILSLIHYTYDTLYKYPIAVLYFLLFIIGPLIYTSIKLFSANEKKDYSHISTMYKIVMTFGVLSLLLYKYILIQ